MLSNIPSRASDLSPDVHSAIEIVLAQFYGHVSNADRDVLSGDVDYFLSNISTISDALSNQVYVVAEYLCKIAHPKSPPGVSDLASCVTTLQNSALLDLPRDLSTARLELINTLTAFLTTHLSLLTTSIRILEQTQHGALARHTKTSAELLHTRATILDLRAQIHTFTHAPPAEFVAALKAFGRAQGTGEKELMEREGLANRELELYEKAG